MADYFNSPNAGQNRRAWLNGLLGSIGDSADYYLGPTGVPDRARSAGQIADMVSPVSGTLRSMDAAGRGNYGEAALEGVGVLAPAAIAARFGAPAAKAVVETMTGTGNALADTGRRITDAIPSDAIYAGRSLAEGDMRGVLDAITPGRPAQGLGADAVKPVTLRGYHGTPDKNSVSAPRVDMKEPGAWFTKNVNYANDYAKGPDGRIFEADITLRNPAVVNFGYNDNGDLVAKLGDEVLDIDNNVDLVREMRRRGYDGLHTPDGNFSEADETFVAFNDDQIAVLPDALRTKAVANDAASNASRAARNAARAAGRAAATPPLPAPRNAAEAVAKDVLDLRAAGRASEVTDEMMAAADDQYMYFNTPIDMDEASRMARAEQFSPALHGTGADISGVDSAYFGNGQDLLGTGFYTTTANPRAERYVPSEIIDGEKVFAEGGNVMPLMVREPRPFMLDESLGDGADEIASIYKQDPFFDVDEMSSGVRIVRDGDGKSAMLDPYQQRHWALQNMRKSHGPSVASDVLSDAGYSGVSGPESAGNRVMLSYDPTDIRSRFARFDPEFRHLRNLSAGVGGLGLLSQIPLQEEQY